MKTKVAKCDAKQVSTIQIKQSPRSSWIARSPIRVIRVIWVISVIMIIKVIRVIPVLACTLQMSAALFEACPGSLPVGGIVLITTTRSHARKTKPTTTITTTLLPPSKNQQQQ